MISQDPGAQAPDKIKKIRSKHNNLLNYFIYDKQDLAPGYIRSCEKFFKEAGIERQAPSGKPQATSSKQQALDKTGL